MAKIARKTKRYPSDLTDEEWDRIAPLMPKPGRCGRPREVEFREVINAVRYLVRSGCGWRMLPVHFGPWQTVYGYFRTFLTAGVWEAIRHYLVMTVREAEGREASPTAVIIDTQSVKTTEKGGLAATTPPRRSRAANAISGSIPPASCLVSLSKRGSEPNKPSV